MKIQFYGCSYSDGGGMDTKEFYDYVKNEDWISEYPIKTPFDYSHNFNINFKNYFRFSDIIKRELNCEIINHACTGNNNQHIFDTLFNQLENNIGDIHVVQWSHFHRQKLWYEKNQKFYRLSGFEKDAVAFEENSDIDVYGDITNFHNQWIEHHFNEEYEKRKVVNYTKLLTSYSNDKNIPIYFITWDMLSYRNEKFINFDDKLNLNKLNTLNTIQKYTKNKIMDGHLSHVGNKMVAQKIINKLKQDELL
jgi:hypothetical protein